MKPTVVAVFSALIVSIFAVGTTSTSAQETPKPNIVFVFLDDNDQRTLENFMPRTNSLIRDEGVSFENATFAQSVCCPNRAAMFRGQYPHNTGIWQNKPPNGGFETFHAKGYHNDTYGTSLKAAGYRTGYFGKVMNGYTGRGGTPPDFVFPGWDRWFAASSPSRSQFVNQNGTTVDFADGTHDAQVARLGHRFIEKSAEKNQPFFAVLSYHGPHIGARGPDSFQSQFTDEELPTPPSYNEDDMSDKPWWLQEYPEITSVEKENLTQAYRDRLRAVEFIDRKISELVTKLDAVGELANTYIVVYSDNGWHMGQHRMRQGKNTPYIEDVRYPLYVRGPGIAPGQVRSELVNSVDLRPTFEDMAGAISPDFLDGESFLPLAQGKTIPWRFFGYSERPSEPGGNKPSWRATYTADQAYHDWNDRQAEEFYDLLEDPFQLDGTVDATEASFLATHRQALSEYRDCSGPSCRSAGFASSEATPEP